MVKKTTGLRYDAVCRDCGKHEMIGPPLTQRDQDWNDSLSEKWPRTYRCSHCGGVLDPTEPTKM